MGRGDGGGASYLASQPRTYQKKRRENKETIPQQRYQRTEQFGRNFILRFSPRQYFTSNPGSLLTSSSRSSPSSRSSASLKLIYIYFAYSFTLSIFAYIIHFHFVTGLPSIQSLCGHYNHHLSHIQFLLSFSRITIGLSPFLFSIQFTTSSECISYIILSPHHFISTTLLLYLSSLPWIFFPLAPSP